MTTEIVGQQMFQGTLLPLNFTISGIYRQTSNDHCLSRIIDSRITALLYSLRMKIGPLIGIEVRNCANLTYCKLFRNEGPGKNIPSIYVSINEESEIKTECKERIWRLTENEKLQVHVRDDECGIDYGYAEVVWSSPSRGRIR